MNINGGLPHAAFTIKPKRKYKVVLTADPMLTKDSFSHTNTHNINKLPLNRTNGSSIVV